MPSCIILSFDKTIVVQNSKWCIKLLTFKNIYIQYGLILFIGIQWRVDRYSVASKCVSRLALFVLSTLLFHHKREEPVSLQYANVLFYYACLKGKRSISDLHLHRIWIS